MARVTRNISLTVEQDKYITDKKINLSQKVQELIDKMKDKSAKKYKNS